MKIKLLLLLFSFFALPLFSQNENANSNSQKTFKVKKLKPIKRNYKDNGNNSSFLNSSSANRLNSHGGAEISETPGELSVSLTGGANYSVPIKVPPGINGVEPEIALSYNSQGGNGLAGYGWNISGLSVISRIPKTKYHDGEVGNVDLSQNDRFSFDGQRLVLKSGTYGASGSTYETENYSNVKIEAFSSYYNGPGYFKVTYPDGSFAYYGQTSNSRTRMDYAITYWQNPQGVRISYEYSTSYNSLSISKIKYGARLTNTPINEIQFEYKTRKRKEQSYVGGVRFVRNSLLSKIKVLGDGVGFRNYELTHLANSLGYERLWMVQEKSGNNLESFDPITFSYQETFSQTLVAEATGDIGLNNVEQRNAIATPFDAGGEGVMDFTIHAKSISTRDKFWMFENVRDENGSFIFPYQVTVGTFQELFPVSYLSHANKILPGQGLAVVQNNGTSDVDFRILSKSATGIYQQYEKTWSAPTYTSQYSCERTGLPSRVPLEYISGDFDGDGLTDVIAITKSYTTTNCYQTLPQPGDPPCELEPFEPNLAKSTDEKPSNGNTGKKDGKELINQRIEPIDGGCCHCDTYSYSSSKAYFINLRRDVTSNFVGYAGYLNSTLSSSDQLITADVNGDGKTDILQVKDGMVYVYSLNNNESLTLLFSYSSSYIDKDYPILLGDYNGDGKTDFMYPTNDNSTYFATFLSTGTTFYRYNQYQPFTYKKTYFDGGDGTGTMYSYNLIPTDINGDGRTDIIDYRTTTYNSSSSGTQTIKTYNNTSPSSSYGNPKFVYEDTRSQTGYLKHYPIPIFLNSEQSNFNLEFCSISHESITAFEFQKDNREDMLLRTVGQNGVYHSIDYAELNENYSNPYYANIYSSTYDEIYPNVDIHYAPGFKLVKSLTRTGSGLTTIKKEFLYHGAVTNKSGLGFSGFKGFASTNWHTDFNDRIFEVGIYSPELRGLPTQEYSTTDYPSFNYAPSSYVSKTDYTYSTPQVLSNKVFKVYKTGSLFQNSLNGSSINMSFTYDSYLNPKVITTNYSTGETERKEFTYSNSTGSNYYIGRIVNKINISTIDGNSFSKEESYTFGSSGLISNKVLKGNGSSTKKFDFSYDIYGNITESIYTAPGETAVTTSMEYDSTHRFMTKKTDHEGLESSYNYNTNNGLLNYEIDPFGFQTSYAYDSWFRKTSISDQTGTTTIDYEKSGNEYTVTTTLPDGSSSKSLFNNLYQLIEKSSRDVTGQWIKVQTKYDHLGRTIKKSEPYIFAAGQWNTTEYDIYGRVIKKTNHNGEVIDISYNGLESTVNNGSKTEIITKNAKGNITEKSTSNTGTIFYTYFGNGKIKKADFNGLSLVVEQDEWGRKTKLTDPSAGVYEYEYDGNSNVTQETNPNGTVTSTFDASGRILTKSYAGNSSMEIIYNYDSTSKLLNSISMTGGGNNSTYTYNYDAQRRITSEHEQTPFAEFLTEFTYNSLNQVTTEKYTATRSGNSSTKRIKNFYEYGQLKSIRDYSSNNLIWEIESLNHRGQRLVENYGNNLQKESNYDNNGFLTSLTSKKNQSGSWNDIIILGYDFDDQSANLNSRTNSLFNWSENFAYDDLDRLIDFNDNIGSNSQDYDSYNRISQNSMIGTYSYAGNSFQQTSLDFNSAGQNYYNNLAQQTVSYNSFKKPIEIYEYGKDRISFQYNAFTNRSNMFYGGTETDKNQRKFVKHYSANGKMEIKFDTETSLTTFFTYLGGDAYTAPAVFRKETGGTSTSETLYLHRDYLGSILGITDENGVFKEKRHFDAWGKLVKLEDGNGNALNNFKVLDRGYTGHEHLMGAGLVHMNGRLYDPILHRFLSPDNYVQNPSDPLSFNRYSYVLNNPLKYIDQNGEFFVAALIGAAIGIITNGITNLINDQPFFKGAVVAGIFGAIGGAAAHGIGTLANNIASTLANSMSSGMVSLTTSAFQAGAHAVLGGGLSLAQGGKFGAGALSGAFSSSFASLTGGLMKNIGKFWKVVGVTTTGGISGGVGSVIGGGNFWAGFRQGAISGGLNHAAHFIQQKIASKILISKIEKAIQAERESMLRFINSDPDFPSPKGFSRIDFNIKDYPYNDSFLGDNEYSNLAGEINVGGKKIQINATYNARPDNFVSYIEHLGSGATPFGAVLVNSFALKGSGTVVRISIPNNSSYQYVKDYLYK